MPDNNIKIPGQRYENAAVAMPTIEAIPGIPKKPQVQPEEVQPQRTQPTVEISQPKAQERKPDTSPLHIPGAWLLRPVKVQGGKNARPLPPVKRAYYMAIGGVCWIASAGFSGLWLQSTVPAFKNAHGPQIGAFVLGVVITFLISAVESFVWDAEDLPLLVWPFLVGLFLFDIYMNIAGIMVLGEFNSLVWLEPLSILTVLVGTTLAILPEKVMGRALR